MNKKQQQIQYQLEQLYSALMLLGEVHANQQLFIGAQIQRLDVIAQCAGVEWERNIWLLENGDQNDLDL